MVSFIKLRCLVRQPQMHIMAIMSETPNRRQRGLIVGSIGGVIIVCHAVLLATSPFQAWYVFNAAIGALLIWFGVLIAGVSRD
jgi:hypothetical protein